MMDKTFRGLSLLLLAITVSFFTACSGQTTEGEKTDNNSPTAAKEETAAPEKAVQTVPEPVAPKEMKIDVSELLELMEEEPNLQLLDVRTPGEVANGTIKGAKVANMKDADFGRNASSLLDKSKPVVVYCAAGSRSSAAIPMLKEQGFTMLYNLSGGISAWSSAGQPLVK